MNDPAVLSPVYSFPWRYPYLISSLFCLAFFLFGLCTFPGQRRLSLWSAVLAAPFSLTTIYYTPDYWHPQRLAAFSLPWGVEDMIYSFALGGVVWLLAIGARQTGGRLENAVGPRWSRYVWVAFLGGVAFEGLRLLGASLMVSTIGSFLFLSGLILWRDNRLWTLSIRGALLYLSLHFLLLSLSFTVWPHFCEQWNHAAISLSVWRVPLEELVWALGFGFTWPLYMAYVFNVRVRER